MYGLVWGKAQQLCFNDDHEYYQALGSLCHRGAYTITFETNSETESWGDAFRIKCLMPDSKTPDAFIGAMKTARRINCNDYVQNLYECHEFDFDVANKVLIGSYSKVKETIPPLYYEDFDNGYNLIFTRYEKREKSIVSTRKTNSANAENRTKSIQQHSSTPQISKPEINVAQLLNEHKWLNGKRIKHNKYGFGTIQIVKCNDSGVVNLDVKFDNPFEGIAERTLGYAFCIDKKLIEIV